MKSICISLLLALIMFFNLAHLAQAADVTVTARGDSGPGTLRQALIDAGGAGTVFFTTGSNSITVYSPLTISQPLHLLGTGVEVIGAVNNTFDVIDVMAANVEIRNLAIVGGANCLQVTGVSGTAVYNCRVGTDWINLPGRGPLSNCLAATNATNMLIGAPGLGNVFSGANATNGCGVVLGFASNNNVLRSNLIGTTSSGLAALPNQYGVVITAGSSNNTIGGDRGAGEQNVISGNSAGGIQINDTGGECTNNVIAGNLVGWNASQSNFLINNGPGIAVSYCSANIIGLPQAGKGNVIAASGLYDILLDHGSQTVVQNNLLGINAFNTVSNFTNYGTSLSNSNGCLIGGTGPNMGNVLSGYALAGRYALSVGANCQGNTIAGNTFGADSTGSVSKPNYDAVVMSGCSNNSITKNLICASADAGIFLSDVHDIAIYGNTIGLNAAGTAALPNQRGIYTSNTCHHLNLGSGLDLASRNVIAGNNLSGVTFVTASPNSHHNVIQANIFGSNAAGNTQFWNGSADLIYTGDYSLIGGNTAAFGNVFAGGVQITGNGNTLASNLIGVLPNLLRPAVTPTIGLEIADGTGNWVGYPAGPGNLIANASTGLVLSSPVSSAILIGANTICAASADPIFITAGANADVPSPILGNVTAGLLTGTAQMTGTVEIFLAEKRVGQGGSLRYLGSAPASPTFSFDLTGLVSNGDYVTAIGNDASYNSSNFAANLLVTGMPIPTATVTPTVTQTPAATATFTPTTTPALTIAAGEVQAFPNPARGHVRFLFNQTQPGDAKVTLYNLTGERVAELKANLPAGTGELDWDCSKVAPGIYMAHVKVQGLEKKLKVAVLK